MASSARKLRSAAPKGDSSGHGGKSLSKRPTPLQVETAEAAAEKGELKISRRLEELSQLESPLLRELAERLGRMLKIETPRCATKFKHPYAGETVGAFWKELQGSKKWEGLLEPNLDRKLKAEILRYGEFAQASYDAFDNNKTSIHYGTCKYTKSNLLLQVGLGNRGYEITHFIYATTEFPSFGSLKGSSDGRRKTGPRNERVTHAGSENFSENNVGSNGNCENCDVSSSNFLPSGRCKNCNENSKQCNWIGFVAVCTSIADIARLGRRDIVVAWRGSKTNVDWLADLMGVMRPVRFGADDGCPGAMAEAGFLHMYSSTNARSRYCKDHSARDQVKRAIAELVAKYRPEGRLSITLTGHSLGSALATLCAYDIAECQLDAFQCKRAPVSAETPPPEQQCADRGSDARALSPSCMPFRRRGVSDRRHRHAPSPSSAAEGAPVEEERITVTVFSFGGPRVGNGAFAKRVDALGVAVLRVVNIRDKVTELPGLMTHRRCRSLQDLRPTFMPHLFYKHVGVKLTVDNELSEYLQKPAGLSRAHCLEAYLHLVDAYQGIKKSHHLLKGGVLPPKGRPDVLPRSFGADPSTTTTDESEEKTLKQRIVSACWDGKYNAYKQTFRDHALVNKNKDFLKPKYAIPPYWWQEKNKGLVQDGEGRWALPSRDETVPGTLEEQEEAAERRLSDAWKRSRPYHDRRARGSNLSRHLTMR